MDNIVLGSEQQEVLDKIKNTILNTKEVSMSLQGSAGVGKTTVLKSLITWLESVHIPYVLTAPTHKAALVMQQATERDAMTLHKLLAMSPKLDILQLDLKALGFNCGLCTEFPSEGVVICDEASMINDELYEFIMNKCNTYNSKVLWVLDPKQIQPVNNKSYSLTCTTGLVFSLNKIYRQSKESALTPILLTLREKHLTNFNSDIKEKSSIFVSDNMNQFSEWFIESYKKAISKSDILYTKVLTYTNNRVQLYNKVIHKLLFGTDEYYKHEFLTCYDNIDYNNTKYWNSMDYIIINDPEQITINIPTVGKLPGYELELYDSLTKTSNTIRMLSKDISNDYLSLIALNIEQTRIDAIRAKNKKSAAINWTKYYSILKSFCSPIDLYFDNRLIRKKTFDYGYAISVHKSQGSSLNNVFIDMRDIYKQKDLEELRQLQYVALSRTRNNVYIYV